jgi:hypothetical protein
MPSKTLTSGFSACNVAALIAVRTGVLSWMGIIPVAKSSFGAAWLTAPSNDIASVPFASTVQNDL